jgi:hypothetical protein
MSSGSSAASAAAAAPLKAALDERTGEVLETEELRAEGLRQLRVAIASHASKTPSFKLVRDDAQFLLPFLRSRKYEVPRALKVLVEFCKFWYGSPGIVNGLCAERVRATYETGYMSFLWHPADASQCATDDLGNFVSLLEIAKLDYSKVNSEDMARLSLYILLPMFEDERMSRTGLTILESFENFSVVGALTVAKKTADPDHQKMMAIGLDTFPMRIRRIFLYKSPTWFNWFWGLVKFFFRKKLRDRLVIVGNDASKLHAVVAADKLPPTFGGTADIPRGALIDALAALEQSAGSIGGFALPLRQDDPTGSRRRFEAQAAAGAAAAGTAAAGTAAEVTAAEVTAGAEEPAEAPAVNIAETSAPAEESARPSSPTADVTI